MDERYDIEAVLLPPTGTGQVLLVGAATLVSYAIDDLELEVEYFVEQAGPDGAGVRCVGVSLPAEAVDDVRRRAQAALATLVAETTELAGWAVRVDILLATDPTDEPDGPDGLDGPDGPDVAVSDDPGDDDLPEVPDTADALLPSGDELLEELVLAIEHEQSVYADAALFRAVKVEELVPEGLATMPPGQRDEALRRANALAGCLIQASVWVVDRLFDDIEELGDPDETGEFEVVDTWILSELPGRFAARYSPQFAKEFLVATVDLSRRLTGGWEPMSCVAQELAMRLILNAVEMVADSADVALADEWREHLEQLLFEDLDHELLYDPSLDGLEPGQADEPPELVPLTFDAWFTPFNEERTLPPYAL